MRRLLKEIVMFITKPRHLGKSNIIIGSKTLFIKSKVVFKGNNNSFELGENTKYKNTRISFYGNNNRLIVKKNVKFNDVDIVFEGNENVIEIGEDTVFAGTISIAVGYNTKIVIGRDSLFSSVVRIRTFDSHHIIDSNNAVVNPAKDIIVGNHCWICQDVKILKGASIPDNSVIGMGSIVTKVFKGNGLLLIGVPAEVKKENINWKK